jgi:hypothetical protein
LASGFSRFKVSVSVKDCCKPRTISLTNWKENLKWHYVQYTNVYNLALSSFVAACYSRKLLQKQFEENLRELN